MSILFNGVGPDDFHTRVGWNDSRFWASNWGFDALTKRFGVSASFFYLFGLFGFRFGAFA